MNLNYAIFRSEPIYTLNDLAQIGSHNKREKKAYNSNPDIDLNKTKNNIELVPLRDKYVKGFYNITKEYKKEHDERMKIERPDRVKTFNEMVNKSKSVVADELLFTATNEFFKDMTKGDIRKWADTCMDFVYGDLGYTKEQVLHATIHLDEKTPHIHCVVIPLIKKFDKRTNSERYTISKKQYIKDKTHLSELQDKYHERLVNNGYDLERGIKNSDSKHIAIKEYKKIMRNLNQELNTKNERLNNAINTLDDNMKSNKQVLFDKDYVKVKKDTFDTMNKVINETKKTLEVQEKVEKVFEEVKSYTDSYQSLEKENNNIKKEIKSLKEKNENLLSELKWLRKLVEEFIDNMKRIFRKMLRFGSEEIKKYAVKETEDYYDLEHFDKNDVIDIAEDTSKEDELFEYISHYKPKDYDYDNYRDNEKDDIGIEL